MYTANVTYSTKKKKTAIKKTMLNAEIEKKIIVRIVSDSILTDTCLQYYPAVMMLPTGWNGSWSKTWKGNNHSRSNNKDKIKETTTERLLWHEWKAETVDNFDFSVSHHCKEINEH